MNASHAEVYEEPEEGREVSTVQEEPPSLDPSHSVNADSSDDAGNQGTRRSAEHGVGLNLGNIHARDVHVIGALHATLSEGSNTPTVTTISESNLRKLKSVYVNPIGYRFQESWKARRIFAIRGLESSGKLTCAVKLAWDLSGSGGNCPRVSLYKRRAEEMASLQEIIRCGSVESGSIVVLEDFEKSISLRELQSPDIDGLEDALLEKKCVLLLTSELELGDLEPLSIVKISIGSPPLDLVLNAHLDYLQTKEVADLPKDLCLQVKKLWKSDLKKALLSPLQVERFCQKLVEGLPQSPSEILKFAREAALSGLEALKNWFGGLQSNEKIFALLVYLFDGLERQLLIEIFYIPTVRWLRAEGWTWLNDHRETGSDDLSKAIQAQDLGNGPLVFSDSFLREEVRRQTRSWSHLLWPVLEMFEAEVQPNTSWDDWQVRRGLGTALGRLATSNQDRFCMCLDRLAGRDWQKGAVVAGYALEEAVRLQPTIQIPLALKKLREWTASGESSLMWTAGAAIPNVYSAVLFVSRQLAERENMLKLTQIMGMLEKFVDQSEDFSRVTVEQIGQKIRTRLVERGETAEAIERTLEKEVPNRLWGLGRRNRECASTTASRIALLDTQQAHILGSWLGRGERSWHKEVARSAIKDLLQTCSKPRFRPDARHVDFLALVVPIISCGDRKDDRELVDLLFHMLGAWLQWDEWRDRIFQKLVEVANVGPRGLREGLCAALCRCWLTGGATAGMQRARTLAQAVLTRAYVMNGVLMDRPNLGRAVFVLDPSFLEFSISSDRDVSTSQQEAELRRKGDACRHLLGLLEAQTEVTFTHLGSLTSVALEESESVPLKTDLSLPRLLMPTIEAMRIGEPCVVLVLSKGPIWDLADVLDLPWADRLLLVTTERAAVETEDVEVVINKISESPTLTQLALVEARLQAFWDRSMVRAQPMDWNLALECLKIDGYVLDHGPRQCLEKWIDGLADPSQATGSTDVARRILGVLGWWAAHSLELCTEFLRQWLESGETLRRSMATSGARMLFRLYGTLPPRDGDNSPSILFEALAEPLGAQGADGSDAVLQALLCWIDVSEWAAYFAGGVIEGRGRLLRWAEIFAPEQVATLRSALPAVKEVGDGATSLRDAMIAATADRLELTRILGRSKVLPALSEGESYGLIVLDPAAGLSTLASQISELFGRICGAVLKPVVFRLGEQQPVWTVGALAPQSELLAPKASFSLPRLIGPILSNPALSPAFVQFVLILTREPLLDAEDWIGTDWRSRIVLYRPWLGRARQPLFISLPPWTLKGEAGAIVRFLVKGVEAEEEETSEELFLSDAGTVSTPLPMISVENRDDLP